MRSITVIILQILVAQAPAKDLLDGIDPKEVADRFINKLMDRLSEMPLDHADLDKSTVAKTHPDIGPALQPSRAGMRSAAFAPPVASFGSSVRSMQNSLRAFGVEEHPMEKLALTALAGTRDVSAAAQVRQVYDSLDAKDKAMVKAEIGSVEMKAQDLVGGVSAPFGFFDPLGLSTKGARGAGTLLFLREAELKHGRVGMVAFLGMLVGEKLHPFYGGNILPAGQVFSQLDFGDFWGQLLFACGIIELLSIDRTMVFNDDSTRIPGDYGYDPLGMRPKDPKAFEEMHTKELNNGRLAMLAAAGIIAQEMATGQMVLG